MREIDHYPTFTVRDPFVFVYAWFSVNQVKFTQFGTMSEPTNMEPKAIIAKCRNDYKHECERLGLPFNFQDIRDATTVVIAQLEGRCKPVWRDIFNGFCFAMSLERTERLTKLVTTDDLYSTFVAWSEANNVEVRDIKWLGEQMNWTGFFNRSVRIGKKFSRVWWVNAECEVKSSVPGDHPIYKKMTKGLVYSKDTEPYPSAE